jgi:Excreted virulence factor EspC, type VII ESX diderm
MAGSSGVTLKVNSAQLQHLSNSMNAVLSDIGSALAAVQKSALTGNDTGIFPAGNSIFNVSDSANQGHIELLSQVQAAYQNLQQNLAIAAKAHGDVEDDITSAVTQIP